MNSENTSPPPPWSETAQYYCARVPKEFRDELILYLSTKKIHTSVHFKPLHKYQVVKQQKAFPIADDEWLKLITLPVHPGMTDEDVEYVIYWVKNYFDEKREKSLHPLKALSPVSSWPSTRV